MTSSVQSLCQGDGVRTPDLGQAVALEQLTPQISTGENSGAD